MAIPIQTPTRLVYPLLCMHARGKKDAIELANNHHFFYFCGQLMIFAVLTYIILLMLL